MEGKESGQSPVSAMHLVDPKRNPFKICVRGVLIKNFLNRIETRPGCSDIRSNYNKTNAQYDAEIRAFILHPGNPIGKLIECLCANRFIDCTDRPKGYLTFIVHGRYNVQQTCVGYKLHKKQLVQSTNLTILAPIGQPNCGVEISRINTNDLYKYVDTDLSRETLAQKTLLEGSESLEIFNIINQVRGHQNIGGLQRFEDLSITPGHDIYQLSPNITEDEINRAINLYIQSHPDKIHNREYLFTSTKRRANVMNHPLSYISGNVTSIHEKAMSYSGSEPAIFLDGPSVSLRIKFKNKHIRKDLPYITINLFSQYNADGTLDVKPTTNANIINISHSIIDAIKELMRERCCPERALDIKHNLTTQLNVIDGSCGTLEKQKCISPETLFEFETGVSDSLRNPIQITQEMEEEEMEEQEMKQEDPPETQPTTQEYSDIAEEITDVAEELTRKREKEEQEDMRVIQPVKSNSSGSHISKFSNVALAKVISKRLTRNRNRGGARRHSQRRQRRNRLSTFRTRYRGRSRAKCNSRTRRRQQHNSSRTKRRKYVH